MNKLLTDLQLLSGESKHSTLTADRFYPISCLQHCHGQHAQADIMCGKVHSLYKACEQQEPHLCRSLYGGALNANLPGCLTLLAWHDLEGTCTHLLG